ncbi:hypothetical protein AAF712_016017, partial [Marasmius tenuissimus]
STFEAVADFWGRMLDTTGPSGFRLNGDLWKVKAIGRQWMLLTPRTATIGQYVSDRSHNDTTDVYQDKQLAEKLQEVFDLLECFPRLTVLCIRVVPFPIADLVEMLASVPRLEKLQIDAGCLECARAPVLRRSITVSALPVSISYLSLGGMHLAAMDASQWETLLLLANLPSLVTFEIDVTTWSAFYDMWRTR